VAASVNSRFVAHHGTDRRPTAATAIRSKPARKPADAIDRVLFWALVAALAWVPFWHGSNDFVAWGINACVFPGLAAIFEISILARDQSHPVGIREIAVPATLFVAVVVWIVIQNATWTPSSWHHPIWEMAAGAIERPIKGSISVNRDLTTLALLRLLTAASVFWVALQLCRNSARANYLIRSIAGIICVYAAYGITSLALKRGSIVWSGSTVSREFVTSTFVNPNHCATYVGIGIIVICGLVLRLYRRETGISGGSFSFRIASFIEATGKPGAILLGGAFLLVVALVLTGSRSGIIATGLGLTVLGALILRRSRGRFSEFSWAIVIFAVVVAAALLTFGDLFLGNVTEVGIDDETRMAIHAVTLRSIFSSPLLGYGYGTFMDVFPMFHDRSVGIQGYFEEANNSYLEAFQGLGLVFGTMLVACVVLLVLRCLKGAAVDRGQGITVPCIAASIAFLVGVHSLADSSLQVQAVALTFIAVLGAGVAQSTRAFIND
jgi:O-antigen ligase